LEAVATRKAARKVFWLAIARDWRVIAKKVRALDQALGSQRGQVREITQEQLGYLKTKRPRSYDRGLLAKEGEGKELPLLYAQPPPLTIGQKSLPIVGTVLARPYTEGMAVL
jgi:hypothetical protein